MIYPYLMALLAGALTDLNESPAEFGSNSPVLKKPGLSWRPCLTPLVGERRNLIPHMWGEQENFQKSYANVIP